MDLIWTTYLKLLGEVTSLRADREADSERTVETSAPSASEVDELGLELEESQRKAIRMEEALQERDRAMALAEVEKDLAVHCDELVEQGASVGETHAAVVKKCKYTIAMPSDPKAALSVVFDKDGVLNQICEGKGYIDMSIVDADTSSKISEIGSHHPKEDFAVRGKEPKDEVQIYTWKDATLRELTDLVKEVATAARRRNARLSFAFVYPDKKGRFVFRQVGTTHSYANGRDDGKTLEALDFQIGDYLSVAIL
ncbi:uncharacterized protein A4U43_C01F11490 [Asparagus officinalis]|uniref:6-phosphogluconate dehydrogenase NADP-binding domain-containing protein n=1 Tax=Asparagus officinalis TaxID=4686 RepID=A0A5P1FPD6_ASPOF|nr:uncharacterized protein A4U43_C01F11490 [Asparagus officinalis]